MSRKLKLEYIPIDRIEISPANVRKQVSEEGIAELADSIADIGLQQPVVVWREKSKYHLIIGQRRYLACKSLGWQDIPAIVTSVESDTDAKIRSFSENIQRVDLDPQDKMRVAIELRQKLGSVSKVAKAIGVSDQTVRNWLGWSAVPDQVKDLVDDRKISVTTAIQITRNIEDEEQALAIAKRVIEEPSTEARRAIIALARENPGESAPEIVRLAKKAKFREVKLNLTPRVAQALESACQSFSSDATLIATEALEEWLERQGFLE